LNLPLGCRLEGGGNASFGLDLAVFTLSVAQTCAKRMNSTRKMLEV
jgi:hypothetical protein